MLVMRARPGVVTVLFLLLTLPAHGQGRRVPSAGTPHLLIYHWWSSSSEQAALNALIDRFRARQPGVAVTAQNIPGGGGAAKLFPIVKARVGAGKAPGAFQMHAGYGAQIFFEAGLLSPIDDLWADNKLEDVMPALIQDLSKLDGHYYSVPINVHRINVVWYHKALLDRHRIDPRTLTTWDAFFGAADTLKEQGVAAPIQMGEGWTATMVFQSIVASQGMDVYEDWVNGKMRKADDPRMREALRIFGRYLTYVNEDHAKTGWDVAVKRIIRGESAFYAMGDWADGEFRLAGLVHDRDYGTLPVPGTSAMYGVTIDSFQHPRGAENPSLARRWLALVSSREGQDAFNPLKGSISARTDADIERYDAYQRSAIAAFKSAKWIFPSVDLAVPDAYRVQLNEIIPAFAGDRDSDKAASLLAATTSRLSPKFTRVWSLTPVQRQPEGDKGPRAKGGKGV